MKNKNFLIILLAVIVILAGFLIISSSNKTEPELIGGDTDEGGCLIGAGYSWCPTKQKCLRVWEEGCTDEDIVRNYLNENLSTLSPEPEVSGGKFFVTDLEFVDDTEVLVTYEDGHNMYRAEFVYEIVGENLNPVSFELREETKSQE